MGVNVGQMVARAVAQRPKTADHHKTISGQLVSELRRELVFIFATLLF